MANIPGRLKEAAQTGSEVRIKALLREPGCDALVQDEYGWTALMWASFKGHEECVGLLIPASDASARTERGLTALMWAATSGHEGCVRLLLPASDASARTERGRTALMWAATIGHEGCVGLLLPASDTFAQDEDGLTASMWARNCKHKSLAQFIDAYARAQSDRTDLEVAVSSGTPRGRPAFRM